MHVWADTSALISNNSGGNLEDTDTVHGEGRIPDYLAYYGYRPHALCTPNYYSNTFGCPNLWSGIKDDLVTQIRYEIRMKKNQ